MKRRTCKRGVLAKHQSTFYAGHGLGNVHPFPSPSRDRCSAFAYKRTSGSVSTTLNVTMTTGGRKRGGQRIITMVNSNSVDKKLTFRKLGGTSTAPGGLLVVLGSGGVTVSHDMKNVGRCLLGLRVSRKCGQVHCGVSRVFRQ